MVITEMIIIEFIELLFWTYKLNNNNKLIKLIFLTLQKILMAM